MVKFSVFTITTLKLEILKPTIYITVSDKNCKLYLFVIRGTIITPVQLLGMGLLG